MVIRDWRVPVGMTLMAFLALTLGLLAQAGACCSITSVDAGTGLVTAKVNANGTSFQFRATDPNLARSLRPGQAVYANFTTKQVSLDGRSACCALVTPPPATTLVTRGNASPIPAFVNAAGGEGVDAANELMALPWRGLSAQYTAQGRQSIASLEGKSIASGSVGLPGNSSLKFDLSIDHIAPAVNITAPPGFRYASMTATAAQKPGFVFQAPLNASWSFGMNANLRGRIEAYGQKLFDGSVPFSVGVPQFRLTAAAVLDTTRLDRPTLVDGFVNPEMMLNVNGIQIPFEGTAKLESGTLVFPARVTNMGFDLGSLAAKLNANITLTIYPEIEQETIDASANVPVVGNVETRLSTAVQKASLAFNGTLTGSVKDPFGSAHDATIPIAFSFPLVMPSSREFNQALVALHPPLPRPYPQTAGPGNNVNVDFSKLAATAASFESTINPRHMPFGAILMIDRREGPGARLSTSQPRVAETYGRLWDSAIWTGHYLAAEAFRYAATNSPEALTRLKVVVAGIQQLFWVTGDAVVENGKTSPVGRTGLLARSALPANNVPGWWEGMPPRNPDGSIPCYYLRPTGGWRQGGRTFATYADAATASGGLAGARGPVPEPVGTVWYGVGCGKGNESPISRDQYDGIMMGLAYAYALVPDESVRAQIRPIVDSALGVIQSDEWSLKLPPDGVISTTWFGDIDMQLDFLRIGATVDPARWLSTYQHFKPASALTWLPGWFSTVDPLAGYYKYNLGQGVFGPLLFLEDDPQARRNYRNAYMMTRSATEQHRNAYFDLVRILIELPQDRQAVAAALAPEVSSLLGEWLERLAKVAAAAPGGFPTNKIPDSSTFAQHWLETVQPFQPLSGGMPYMTRYPFPLRLRAGDSDFLWETNPFKTGLHVGSSGSCAVPQGIAAMSKQLDDCASAAWREGAAIDFLLPYWMSSYFGLMPK